MTKKITTFLLVLHVMLLMLVVAYNSGFEFQSKGMIVVYVMSVFLFAAVLSVKYVWIYPAVITGCAAYFILNVVVLIYFLKSSADWNDTMMFAAFFLPGVLTSLMLGMILFRGKKPQSTDVV